MAPDSSGRISHLLLVAGLLCAIGAVLLSAKPGIGHASATGSTDSGSTTITLNPGWNLVGWLQPSTPIAAALTADVASRIDSLWGYDAPNATWEAYFPSAAGIAGANDLTELESQSGYFVHVDGVAALKWDTSEPGGGSIPAPPRGADGSPAVFATGDAYATYVAGLADYLTPTPTGPRNVMLAGTVLGVGGDGSFTLSPTTGGTSGSAVFLDQGVGADITVVPTDPSQTAVTVGIQVIVIGYLDGTNLHDAVVATNPDVHARQLPAVVNRQSNSVEAQSASTVLTGQLGLPGIKWESPDVTIPAELMKTFPGFSGIVGGLSLVGCSASFSGQVELVAGAGANWAWPVWVQASPSELTSGSPSTVQISLAGGASGDFSFRLALVANVVLTMHTCRGDYPLHFSVGLPSLSGTASGTLPLSGQSLTTTHDQCPDFNPFADILGVPPGVGVPNLLGWNLCVDGTIQGAPITGFVAGPSGTGGAFSSTSGASLNFTPTAPSAGFNVSQVAYTPHVDTKFSLNLIVADQEVDPPIEALGDGLPSFVAPATGGTMTVSLPVAAPPPTTHNVTIVEPPYCPFLLGSGDPVCVNVTDAHLSGPGFDASSTISLNANGVGGTFTFANVPVGVYTVTGTNDVTPAACSVTSDADTATFICFDPTG